MVPVRLAMARDLRILAALLCMMLLSSNAVAEDPIGLYVGGSIGQSQLHSAVSVVSADIAPMRALKVTLMPAFVPRVPAMPADITSNRIART
jgi:hypothetical protein